MIQLTALYGHPQDPTAFDNYYQQTHAPLALKIPGLKGYIANKPSAISPHRSSRPTTSSQNSTSTAWRPCNPVYNHPKARPPPPTPKTSPPAVSPSSSAK